MVWFLRVEVSIQMMCNCPRYIGVKFQPNCMVKLFGYIKRLHMWCDLGKSVGTRTCNIFSFLFEWSAHLERYILLKTPPELVQWFQINEQLKDSQNRKRKEFFFIVLHNQCSHLATDSARSQRIFHHIVLVFTTKYAACCYPIFIPQQKQSCWP